MQDKSFLEVLVHYADGEFVAKSPKFPFCKGKGSTRKSALRQLRLQIANTVYTRVQTKLKDLFEECPHRRVIINPNDSEKTHHYLYNFDDDDLGVMMFFQLKSLPEYSHLMPHLVSDSQKNFFKSVSAAPMMSDKVEDVAQSVSKDTEETIILGYPLCLN